MDHSGLQIFVSQIDLFEISWQVYQCVTDYRSLQQMTLCAHVQGQYYFWFLVSGLMKVLYFGNKNLLLLD